MVRSALIMGLAMLAGPTTAQDVDWRRAGGDLFGRAASVQTASAVGQADDWRVPALSQPYQAAIAEAAEAYGLDPKLLHALVITESAYRADALSSAGAGGLTQLMPGTASDLGVANRFDVDQNLRGGADYLARQIRRFGNLRLALAAYNSGPARVATLGRVPNIPETRAYVSSVLNCFLALTAGRTVTNSLQCAAEGEAP
jgi:soluble lytic murein transglycosylase-like protein